VFLPREVFNKSVLCGSAIRNVKGGQVLSSWVN